LAAIRRASSRVSSEPLIGVPAPPPEANV